MQRVQSDAGQSRLEVPTYTCSFGVAVKARERSTEQHSASRLLVVKVWARLSVSIFQINQRFSREREKTCKHLNTFEVFFGFVCVLVTELDCVREEQNAS